MRVVDALWVCELCVPVCRRVLRAGGRQGAAGAEAGALRRAALPARRLLPRPAGECHAAASALTDALPVLRLVTVLFIEPQLYSKLTVFYFFITKSITFKTLHSFVEYSYHLVLINFN